MDFCSQACLLQVCYRFPLGARTVRSDMQRLSCEKCSPLFIVGFYPLLFFYERPLWSIMFNFIHIVSMRVFGALVFSDPLIRYMDSYYFIVGYVDCGDGEYVLTGFVFILVDRFL